MCELKQPVYLEEANQDQDGKYLFNDSYSARFLLPPRLIKKGLSADAEPRWFPPALHSLSYAFSLHNSMFLRPSSSSHLMHPLLFTLKPSSPEER